MKKKLILLITLFVITITLSTYSAYKIGFDKGVKHHTLTQEIYSDKNYYYSNYNGRVDRYYK